MKFTENFSEGTKSKAEFLEQIDLNVEKERLTNELIEEMGPFLAREEIRFRKDGMSEENIQKAIKKKELEILSTYTANVEVLKQMIGMLRRYNKTYGNKDEVTENRGR